MTFFFFHFSGKKFVPPPPPTFRRRATPLITVILGTRYAPSNVFTQHGWSSPKKKKKLAFCENRRYRHVLLWGTLLRPALDRIAFVYVPLATRRIQNLHEHERPHFIFIAILHSTINLEDAMEGRFTARRHHNSVAKSREWSWQRSC